MLIEFKSEFHHYFKDEQGYFQGEYKEWDENGILRFHCIYANSELHGEYKRWSKSGLIEKHCFFINNRYIPFIKIPLPPCPTTEEDRVYYHLKYNVQLLPVEQIC